VRILIAEDELSSRLALAAVLKKLGHEVVATVDGVEAWKVLQHADAPRLVILDWMMPEMDGPGVVRLARAMPTDTPPYILMLTAKRETADIIAGLDAGANDYLVKPFDPGELRARVEVGRRMIEMQDALVRSREVLAHQATHDPLTGLLNRRAILDRLREELARAGRQGGTVAVGSCDIDHFKRVNDTYGHQTGDDVICGLARMLDAGVREYDAVGRVGGEEFLVVLPVPANKDSQAVFTRLCGAVGGHLLDTRSGPMSVTVSIGVAIAAASHTVDYVLERADAALYQAKAEGRNRVVSLSATSSAAVPDSLPPSPTV
jgi:diguanylate cyclase (GGDEF)-like protein